MATVAEKSGTLGSCIDDIAGMLGGLSAWIEVDGSITNTGDTGSWRDNGCLFQNTNMGIYVLFYVLDSDNDPAGIRVHVSEGWDSDNAIPSGKSNTLQSDPFSGNKDVVLGGSYANQGNISRKHDNAGLTISGGNDMDLDRTYNATYFLSAGPGYFNGAIWNTTDSDYGASGAFSMEWVDDKLWDDGNVPFSYTSVNHHKNGIRRVQCAYGWSHVHGGGKGVSMSDVYNRGGFQRSWWGRINPDSNDDTFFFSKPVVYQTLSKEVPVAYIDACARNDPNEGASHGDVITYNGTDYKCMRQSGAGWDTNVSVLLKYE